MTRRRHPWSAAALGSSALLLGACAVGPNFKAPAAPQSGFVPADRLPAQTASSAAGGGEAQKFVQDLDIPGLGGELAGRPRIIALNKIDVPEAAELAEFVTEELAEQGWPVVSISTATHAGLRELTFLMAREVARYRAALPPPEPTRLVLRPTPTRISAPRWVYVVPERTPPPSAPVTTMRSVRTGKRP